MSRVALRPTLLRYVLVVVLAAAAQLATQFVSPLQRIPFALSFGVVLVSSIYLGRGPGLFAILVTALAGAYLFLGQPTSWRVGVEGAVQASVFASVSMLIWYVTDKRRRAEEELKRREQELSDFLENATVGLHWVGPDGLIKWTNRAELEMLGYGRDEYVGRHIGEFHADPEVISDILGRLSRGEELHGYEARLRCKDGSIRHVAINSNVFWDADGRFVHTRCFTRDITDRKREEEAQARLAAIVESAEDAIVGKDLEGIITSWNRGAERLYGYAAAEVVGRSISVLIPPDNPDELPRIMGRLRSGERIEHYETRRVTKDGRPVDVSLTISPIRDSAGRATGASTVARDITERKRAEEAQRFLGEASEVLVGSLDYEATLRRIAALVVPRLADWCAVDVATEERTIRRIAVAHQDPAKVELARELEGRYPPSYADREGAGKVMRTGEPSLLAEIDDELLARGTRDEEHLRITRGLGLRSAMIVPLAAQGRVIGAITFASAESGRRYAESDLALAEDLAHRAALAVENARLYREAQEVNRLKDEFLATLSHELRTPLTAVLGWTRLIGTGQLDAETHARALETIERNAQAQVQLIDDILDVSRIIRGKLRLNVRSIYPAPLVEAAVDSVRPAAEAKGIRLHVVLDPRAGPVPGDPDRLQQIVWNLLSNAVKFTPRGGRVQVVLSRVDSQLQITVSDDGAGIRADFLPHVFERFRQADPTTTRTHGGLGLGLAIVRHMVELHGGTVRAESAGEGRGSTFRVTLPLLASAPPEEGPPPAQPGTDGDAGGNGFFPSLDCPPELSGVRVLVVEDDADSRELLVTVLEHCRADVRAVAGAAEGLAAVEEWLPHVLVSDIEMPGEDGYALIRRVRALPAERGGRTPACALTAYARAEDRMRALVAGFQIHVPKPVEPAELATVVASLAGRAVEK